MMSKKQFIIGIFVASLLSAAIAIGGFNLFYSNQLENNKSFDEIQNLNTKFSSYIDEDAEYNVPEGINFIFAAENVTEGVVHIRSSVESSSQRKSPYYDMFKDYFNDENFKQYHSPAQSSGSGVVISPDGYIVTNNHVVDNATEIEVILSDNKKYMADVIGTDPNTDIALLKIEADNMKFVKFGDSDQTKIGEWVLAVGNPFNLTSTVTAGIVSAKARNINILNRQNRYGIESFIQTDAAVNPGNSGGALVNLKGELIGVNTAIATPTGSFAGYSFAVPSTLVKKVVNDLKEYGVVQRAVLGVSILDLNDPRLESQDFSVSQGVYIGGVNQGSAADEAGIQQGDIVIKINDNQIENLSELQELVARNRPGEEIDVTYLRDGKETTVTATLKNIMNNTEVIENKTTKVIGGATIVDVTNEEKQKLNIQGGAKITDIDQGKWSNAGVKEGFIITGVDKKDISDAEDLLRTLQTKRGGILIEGIYPDGTQAYYGMGW